MAEPTSGPSPGTSRQFWIEEPGTAEILTRPLPERQEGEVLVRALYSGISRGTEALVFQGRVAPSQHVAMRAPFQEGVLPGPVKYGYSSVGEVIEGEGAEAELVGRRVFCLYPHQDYYVVRASSLSPLPAELPPPRAVLAANMETAVNGVWDSGVSAGDRIVVIGAGAVGLLVAWLCSRIPGTTVTVIDRNPSKARAAEALSLSFATECAASGDADAVFHASGSPAGLRDALGAAGQEAAIIELSWYGDESVCLPLGDVFHPHRLSIKSSQVGRIPPGRTPRWTPARRMALALSLLREERLDALITGESDFDDLPEVMRRLSKDPGAELCHRIRY
jgi:threonine dehydrogenase-like Zn-dependent dehydrogenase